MNKRNNDKSFANVKLCIYVSTTNKATECSPFYLVFGRLSHLPIAVPYPEFFWAHWYMYWEWDSNKSIGEHTRETDRQKLWLYLAAFQCQTTKQSYKIIR